MQQPFSKNLRAAALVPGLPHLLQPEKNKGYQKLVEAMDTVSQDFKNLGVERIVYYSTQWISVLAHMFQAHPLVQGLHVDENWHDMADLPFDFKVDDLFAQNLAEEVKASGEPTALVAYEGFPVDTATIVADRYLNPLRVRTNMVSCHVYSDFSTTEKLGQAVRQVIEKDEVPTAVVAVSLLSAGYFTTDIDVREDRVSSPQEDLWNRQILGFLEEGKHQSAIQILQNGSREIRTDMGFKAYGFLRGIVGEELRPASCRAYGAVYGTGAACVVF